MESGGGCTVAGLDAEEKIVDKGGGGIREDGGEDSDEEALREVVKLPADEGVVEGRVGDGVVVNHDGAIWRGRGWTRRRREQNEREKNAWEKNAREKKGMGFGAVGITS